MAWLTGYPREKVNWFPTINPEKCVKCGICMNCGKNVYKWTNDGAAVVNPYNCVVGCTTCSNLCRGNAITHPDISELLSLYKEERIWTKVKKELIEQGKLTVEDD